MNRFFCIITFSLFSLSLASSCTHFYTAYYSLEEEGFVIMVEDRNDVLRLSICRNMDFLVNEANVKKRFSQLSTQFVFRKPLTEESWVYVLPSKSPGVSLFYLEDLSAVSVSPFGSFIIRGRELNALTEGIKQNSSFRIQLPIPSDRSLLIQDAEGEKNVGPKTLKSALEIVRQSYNDTLCDIHVQATERLPYVFIDYSSEGTQSLDISNIEGYRFDYKGTTIESLLSYHSWDNTQYYISPEAPMFLFHYYDGERRYMIHGESILFVETDIYLHEPGVVHIDVNHNSGVTVRRD